MSENTRMQIRDFIAPRLNGRILDDDHDIFALGYVNSLFAMQLARFVQTEFRVILGPEDMEFDNFRTINGIVSLVEAKTRATTSIK